MNGGSRDSAGCRSSDFKYANSVSSGTKLQRQCLAAVTWQSGINTVKETNWLVNKGDAGFEVLTL